MNYGRNITILERSLYNKFFDTSCCHFMNCRLPWYFTSIKDIMVREILKCGKKILMDRTTDGSEEIAFTYIEDV